MILKHRKKKGYVIEKGFLGREKKIEQEYYYERHNGLPQLADHVAGKKWAPREHTHWVGEIEYANIVENHHDAAGYDALYTVGREILKQITKTRDPGGIFMKLLHSFGRENSRAYVKYVDVDNPNLEDTLQSILIYHRPYEEFYEQHKDEFVKQAVETAERLMRRKLTSEERQKIERAFELAVEYGKRFHDIYKNVSEDKYHQTAVSSKTHHEEGYKSVEYAEKVLGIDFLDHVEDIILELNKLLPGFSKPEEVYGDRWFEFLKKRGIDPKTLEPIGAKPRFPEAKKTAIFTELLAISKALKYAGFSEEAMKRAERDLLNRLDRLLENPEENAIEIAYAVKLLRLVQKKETERIAELTK